MHAREGKRDLGKALVGRHCLFMDEGVVEITISGGGGLNRLAGLARLFSDVVIGFQFELMQNGVNSLASVAAKSSVSQMDRDWLFAVTATQGWTDCVKLHAMSLLSVWLASLVGSTHCVGMCGGFVSALTLRFGKGVAPIALYHTGRIATYALLGTVAAWFGGRIDSMAAVQGMQRVSVWIFAAWLLFQVLDLLLPWSWFDRVHSSGIGKIRSIILKPLGTSKSLGAAFGLGVATAWLPCGWLYTFIAMAMASGALWRGAAIMLVFGLGTLPALVVFEQAVRAMMDRLVHRVPWLQPKVVTVLLLLSAGIWSIVQQSAPHDHHHGHHSHH